MVLRIRSLHSSVIKRLFKNIETQGRCKGRTSRTAARGANLHGMQRCHWNSRKYGSSKLKFTHAKIKKKTSKIIGGLGTRLEKVSPALC